MSTEGSLRETEMMLMGPGRGLSTRNLQKGASKEKEKEGVRKTGLPFRSQKTKAEGKQVL